MSEESSQNTSATSLDGGWFRRERERIAVGRRVIAERLQVPERQIALLETKKLPVPAAWLPVVAELGFSVSGAPAISATSESAAAPIAETTPESAAAPTAETTSEPAAPAAAPTESTAVAPVAEPGPPSPEVVVVAAAPTDVETLVPVATHTVPAAVVPAPHDEMLPPPPAVLRGHALRDRRYELSLSSRKLCQALKISETDLSLLESNNLMAPSGFLPVLVKLGFYSQQTPPEAAPRTLSGRWLREQRRDKGISSAVVSQTVNTRQALVTLIEARDWPLPPEWIPALASLGLSEQGELSRRGAEKKESRSKKAAASPARSAVKPATKHATKDAAAAPPSELTGAWLRTERERLGLSQTALGQKLGISQSDMSRYELRDRRLPTEWWPLLKELGFAVPADLLSRLAQKLSDVLSRSAASTPASSATPLKAEKPAPKKGDAKAKALPKKAAKTDEEPQSARSEDLLQMIVEYRLSFGRRVGQSASEILSQIAQDLQLAGIGQSISHETLAAAMRQLFIAASRVRSKAS